MTRVLWDYPDLLFITYPLAYVLALWLFLEGSMESDRPGEARAKVLSQQLLPCWLCSLGCSGGIDPCLVGYFLLQPREKGSLHVTSSTSFLTIGNLEVWTVYGLILSVLPCANCFTVLFVILRLILLSYSQDQVCKTKQPWGSRGVNYRLPGMFEQRTVCSCMDLLRQNP